MAEPVSKFYPPIVSTDLTATIASSGTTSDAIDLRGNVLCGLEFPAAFTGSEVSFQVADTIDGTYNDLQDPFGNDVVVAAAASKNIGTDIDALLRARFIKVVSNQTEAAAREIKLFVRPV